MSTLFITLFKAIIPAPVFFHSEKSPVTQRGYKKFPTVNWKGQKWEGRGMSDPT